MTNVFASRSFRRLWLGQAVSLVGDTLFTTTLTLWLATGLLAGKAYAPAAASAALAITAGITIVLAPIAGVFVDRWDKVRVALATDGVRAIVSLGFVAMPLLPAAPLGVTLVACAVGVAVQAAASQFFNPARLVLMSDVVAASQRAQAASFAQGSSAIATIVGPLLGGVLYVAVGPTLGFALNALSFLCSYVMIKFAGLAELSQRPIQAKPQSFGRELIAPLRTIATSPILRTILGTGIIVMLGAGTFGSLNVFFVQENLGKDAWWFGVLSGALGAGILVGALGAGFLGPRIGERRLFVAATIICGTACLAYSRSSDAVFAAALLFIYGIAGGVVETVMSPLVLTAVDRTQLARVVSVFAPAFRLSSIISVTVAGTIVSLMRPGHRFPVAGMTFGRIDVIYLGTGVIFLGAGLFALFSLRNAAPSLHVEDELDSAQA
jgi:MFS family permease